jgi:hypothetical protein
MFLLTDGEDEYPQFLQDKLNLARTIKSSGTSLFVFGFGTDHDSEHMDAIANAAEGIFTYVESDSMVTDAFGGTIGAQQGQSLLSRMASAGSASAAAIVPPAMAVTRNLMIKSRVMPP